MEPEPAPNAMRFDTLARLERIAQQMEGPALTPEENNALDNYTLCEDCQTREGTWETMDAEEASLCSECVTKRANAKRAEPPKANSRGEMEFPEGAR